MKKDWDWNVYYDERHDPPMRATLEQVFGYWEERAPGYAVDLGCGSGNDTIHMLKAGWRVLAMDKTEDGIKRLMDRPDIPDLSKLETKVAEFEDYVLPSVDWVNASYALPFCEPDAFPDLWRKIRTALKPGGVFSAHFFGPHDGWVKHGLTIHTRDELETMLDGLNILFFDEIEEDTANAYQKTKHWHVFKVVASCPQ